MSRPEAAGVDAAHAESQLAQAELIAMARSPPRLGLAAARPDLPAPPPAKRPPASPSRAHHPGGRAPHRRQPRLHPRSDPAQAQAAHAAVEKAGSTFSARDQGAGHLRGGRPRRPSGQSSTSSGLSPDERRPAWRGLCDRQLQGDPGGPPARSATGDHPRRRLREAGDQGHVDSFAPATGRSSP